MHGAYKEIVADYIGLVENETADAREKVALRK